MRGTEMAAPLLAMPCFSTLGCGELDLEDVLALAVRRRMPAVELRTLAGRNALPEYFETRYGTPERLRDVVAGFPVRIASLDSSCRAIDTTQEGRAELLALAPWATAAGAPTIRVFDGGKRGDEAELSSMRPLFDWWQELAVAPKLMVETHDALAHPAALQRFIEQYPIIGVLWDTHHTWKVGGEAPAVTWSRLRGRTRHLHVKDSGVDGGYVAPGTGLFPFHELIDVLRADSFGGIISLEWERHWYPELPPIETALDGFERVLSLTGSVS
jgi:sugar phosphate isomerase/epimerase